MDPFSHKSTYTYLLATMHFSQFTNFLSLKQLKGKYDEKNIAYRLSYEMMMIMCRDCDSFRFLPSVTLHLYLYISNEENCIFGSFLEEKISLSHLLASHMPQNTTHHKATHFSMFLLQKCIPIYLLFLFFIICSTIYFYIFFP